MGSNQAWLVDQPLLPFFSARALTDEEPDYFVPSLVSGAPDADLQSSRPPFDTLDLHPRQAGLVDTARSIAKLSLTVTSDTVPISTAFHANAIPPPNSVFLSSDHVIFYVHDGTILESCPKAFESYLRAPLTNPRFRKEIIRLDAPSAELNVILHALYGTSAALHSPDTDTLVNAIDRMPAYGISPASIIRPLTYSYDLLLSHALVRPLDIYALAAHHDIPTLATRASANLLAYDLTTITNEMAERIGAIYLKKLLTLHLERSRSLKQILLRPPHPHPPTNECGFRDQDRLVRTWALVSAYFVWDAQPGEYLPYLA